MAAEALIEAAEVIRDSAAQANPWLSSARIAAVGWATVEWERAATELSRLFGPSSAGDAGPAVAWTRSARESLLGAAAWVAADGATRDPTIVILEPDTEGRLAAS